MARQIPRIVDTVVVGNGPSALILSYILHGNIPAYDPSHPHPDPLLHSRLRECPDFLNLDIDYLTEHFSASRFPYSTQALPVNVLLDTLFRPHGETDDTDWQSCVSWDYRPERCVSHVVVGNAHGAGGQWVDNPVKASWDIGTLSYATMLSLPGYSFDQFHLEKYGRACPPFARPTRRTVAEYFSIYPQRVAIEDAIFCNLILSGISRTKDGFYVASHDISCKHLVLASGTFSDLIPARALLQPLLHLPAPTQEQSSEPVLVIGSGFSAADVIISLPSTQKLIHIYKWAPNTAPSPLRACHQQAYPEYAGVYKRMKVAARSNREGSNSRPKPGRASSTFDTSREWDAIYEGLPNTVVAAVEMNGNSALVTLRDANGGSFVRRVGGLHYVVGRRGNLDYLDDTLRNEVWPGSKTGDMLSGNSLREKANESLEMARGVYITGSLTGDSLIRFAYGGCVQAAGRILSPTLKKEESSESSRTSCCSSKVSSPRIPAMQGLDGHGQAPTSLGAAADAADGGS